MDHQPLLICELLVNLASIDPLPLETVLKIKAQHQAKPSFHGSLLQWRVQTERAVLSLNKGLHLVFTIPLSFGHQSDIL
jgi:hypothetical protein